MVRLILMAIPNQQPAVVQVRCPDFCVAGLVVESVSPLNGFQLVAIECRLPHEARTTNCDAAAALVAGSTATKQGLLAVVVGLWFFMESCLTNIMLGFVKPTKM